ncbi:helix-turn-helix transcriptional regulator [Kitasatospora sp. NPDC047058]|uniref:helix-turn-helix domain-containing protein n=1 Tax=Kitasatospora sp. NPDC047058 TaxID=3155620 RepID=UPI0033ECB576
MHTDTAARHRTTLGEFLKARRALLRPEQAGLPGHGLRRVPGLRREEVALLAGVSTDYYLRLEQGRERNPSQQIVDALARALRLDDEALAHLRRLARPVARRRPAGTGRVGPQLLRLMNGWSGTPALVVSGALDVLALNPLAAALYSAFAQPRNLVRMTFLDPAADAFHRDRSRAARAAVAALREAAGRDRDDPRIIELVGELSLKSRAFAELWARHEVRGKTGEAKLFHHPQVGDLDLHYEAFAVRSAPGQQLVVYQAEPGSPSADALALLAGLAAEAAPAADAGTVTEPAEPADACTVTAGAAGRPAWNAVRGTLP